jgi:hypothetical protein
LKLIYNKLTSRSYGYFLKFSYFIFVRNWWFQLRQKLQSLVKKTQGILGITGQVIWKTKPWSLLIPKSQGLQVKEPSWSLKLYISLHRFMISDASSSWTINVLFGEGELLRNWDLKFGCDRSDAEIDLQLKKLSSLNITSMNIGHCMICSIYKFYTLARHIFSKGWDINTWLHVL